MKSPSLLGYVRREWFAFWGIVGGHFDDHHLQIIGKYFQKKKQQKEEQTKKEAKRFPKKIERALTTIIKQHKRVLNLRWFPILLKNCNFFFFFFFFFCGPYPIKKSSEFDSHIFFFFFFLVSHLCFATTTTTTKT